MKPANFSLMVAIIFLLSALPTQAENKDQERKLWNALTYLKSLPELGWMEIEGSNVILGWKGYPARFSQINKTAAKNASKRARGEINIYSVKSEQTGWRPGGDNPNLLCMTTSRAGGIKFTNCK